MKIATCTLFLNLTAAICAAQPAIEYEQRVKPVLQSRCYACHGALKQAAGLRLDTARSAMQGGDNGAAIIAGDVKASLLMQRVTASDESERMPPEGEPLKPAEIAVLEAWIAQGAVSPADEKPERDPRDHWAFRAPVRPVAPGTHSPEWGTTPIDVWVNLEHHKRGLTPQGPADKRVWLRRVSLDLIGLPPSLEQSEAFVADDSPDAFEKVVTRLLESPQYGERWGRHWMDIWRYSDWWGLGAEVRNSQKHIWHWRDWIIESLNEDLGYDQMLREMLAADELYPNDLKKLRAGGFLARQYFKFNRTSWLDETIEHTSKAMLGLTFNCAKCHDHKFDPLTQQDYYQFRAIFEPYQIRTDALPGEIDFEKNGLPRPFDCNLEASTYVHIRGDDRNPDKSRSLLPGVPALLVHDNWMIEPVALPAEAIRPGLRPYVAEAYLSQARERIARATEVLSTAETNLVESIEAERLAAALRNDDTPADALAAFPQTLESDDFSVPRTDLWEVRDGEWTYSDGRLRQGRSGAHRMALRWLRPFPADFEARLNYIPTGGDQWKSIGIAFDSNDRGNEILAYVSCSPGGQKAQLAYRKDGNYIYPAEAAQSRTVELNKPHQIILRVRGSLVNLSVDGQHSVAYRLPVPRLPGHLELITFDAQAEFQAFEISDLLSNRDLVEPAVSQAAPARTPLPVEHARLAVVAARDAVAVASVHLELVQARAAADAARWQSPAPQNLPDLIATAGQVENRLTIAKAAEDVSRTEFDLVKAPAEKKAEIARKLNDARTSFESARKAAESPRDTYQSLVGSLKTLESNLESEESRRKPFPEISTGRRTAFARWLTDRRNPLTARVAVNHIWSRHFGKPLVPTVFDFGRKGASPTHPELLDWLAVELMESGWKMKPLHRLIVLSRAYRMTSSEANVAAGTKEADPDNRFLWRANPIRMEAQAVRDSLLFLAGELDLTRGGPSIPIADESSKRRSLYFVHSHNEHQKFLSMFDDASVLECYRRSESIVPQQALALENSGLATSMAERISRQITSTNPDQTNDAFVRAAFVTVLSTRPTDAEQSIVFESLSRFMELAERSHRPDPQGFARARVVQALLNHNDFVTVR